MRPQVWSAWEAFHTASEAWKHGLHDPGKAAALVHARDALENSLSVVLARVPYRARKVADLRPRRDGGHVHLAVSAEIAIHDWHRARGQTLCGAAPGRYAGDRPVTCTACLRLLDRHVDQEPNPPELPLF